MADPLVLAVYVQHPHILRRINPESFSLAITRAERAVCVLQLSQDVVRMGDSRDIKGSALAACMWKALEVDRVED